MIYNYEEVKEFFGEDCFRMSDVRGGVIIPKTENVSIEDVLSDEGFFRVGPYILYLHDQTAKYVIGSFACSSPTR